MTKLSSDSKQSAAREPRRARPAAVDCQQDRSAWWDSFLEAGPIQVSVCIVNWNCRVLLRNCLESLLDTPQGLRLEIIVVDNASQDGAADMVAEEFPEVTLVRNAENRGFARGNNQAARLARGRYLLFLNNDTVVPPGTLAKLVDYAEAHPEVGMIGPLLRGDDGQVQTSWRTHPSVAALLHRTCLLRWTGLLRADYQSYRRQELDTRPRQVEMLMGAALLVPRTVFEADGGWDEGFDFGGEDMELSSRIGRRRPLVYLPVVEIIHHGRASTRAHGGVAFTNVAIGMARYLRCRGVSAPGLFVYKLIVTLDAPVHVLVKLCEYAWRKLRRRERAGESWRVMSNFAHFLRHGLLEFWKV